MLIQEKVYHDEKLGHDADIKDVTNVIGSIDDIAWILKEIIDRHKDGYTDFKISKQHSLELLTTVLAVDFIKGNDWKYIKMRLDPSAGQKLVIGSDGKSK